MELRRERVVKVCLATSHRLILRLTHSCMNVCVLAENVPSPSAGERDGSHVFMWVVVQVCEESPAV